MRVLHVIESLSASQGGPSNALVGLALAQRKQGLAVTIAACDDNPGASRANDLEKAGIRCVMMARTSWPARMSRRPSSSMESLVGSSDIVHIHGVWEHLVWEAAIAAAAADVPYIIRSCGMLDEWALRRKALKKRLYIAWRLRGLLQQAAALHCTTHMEAESTGRVKVHLPQIIVEPNGVSIEEFDPLPSRGGFRSLHSIGNQPLIVFLGRVQPGKGVEYLLPALPFLQTRDAVVAVVGPDSSSFAAEMKERAETVDSSARVIFTGMLRGRERVGALVDADVFVLPSEHENFGISVVEALAAGCPVVISEHVALKREVIACGVGLATSLSPAHIASALDEWLSRARQIERPFATARRFAFDTFDWNRIAGRWHRHYARLAG